MIKYLEDNLGLTQDERQRLQQKGSQIYEAVIKDGGFVKVFCQRELPNYLKQDDWAHFYQSKIIAWEYKSITVDGSLIQKPYYYSFREMVSLYNENSLNWLKHQIAIFSIDEKSLYFLNQNFTKEWLKKYHGSQEIDIRQQQINYDSFSLCVKNQQFEGLTLKEYFDYLDQPTSFNKKFEIPKDQKLFAVNVSMNGWNDEISHLNNFMPKCLQSQGQNDALSYLRQQIDGVTVPQLYIKTDGVWTGGHQENLSVTSININHGPSDCIWISIDNIDIPKLRKLVKEQFQVEILLCGGLWYKEPEWFLKNNVKFRYTIQKPGDVIILGPGCLHWVKSCGYTINSSWNLAALNEETLEAMSQRYQINQEIKFKAVIPYKNLMLDIYIHEKQLNRRVLERIQSELQAFFDDENKKMQLIGSKATLVASCKEVQICTKCENEILLYFYHEDQDYLCLECVRAKVNCNQLPISLKYRFHNFYYVLQQQPKQCDAEYCSLYTGNTKCQVQEQLKLQMKQHKSKKSSYSNMNSISNQQESINEETSSEQFSEKNTNINCEEFPNEPISGRIIQRDAKQQKYGFCNSLKRKKIK